jgi:hypothetical protein
MSKSGLVVDGAGWFVVNARESRWKDHCKAAARHGASVARETSDAAVAYAKDWAKLPRSLFTKYRRGWLPDD